MIVRGEKDRGDFVSPPMPRRPTAAAARRLTVFDDCQRSTKDRIGTPVVPRIETDGICRTPHLTPFAFDKHETRRRGSLRLEGEKQAAWCFEVTDHIIQEPCGRCSVDQSMVVREA